MCARGCEDIKHALFTCPRASEIWRCLKLDGFVEEASNVDRAGSSVLDHILCMPTRGSLLPEVSAQTLILVGIWYIWWERRQLVHGEEVQSPARSALSISALAANYTHARKKETWVNKERWIKPMEGCVKLNVDAAFHAETPNGAVGAVLRDDRGGFIAASNGKLEHVTDVATAEAFALRHGLLLAQQVGVNKLVVEADCQEVINTMNMGGFTATGAAAVYADCNVLIVGYTSVSFVHCPREANCVSHELARLAVSNPPSLWVEELPASIVRWLVDDVMVI